MDDWIDPEPLRSAAQDGDLRRLQELVAQGWSIHAFDELGMTPLHYAAQYGRCEAAQFLIRAGADVNANDERMIGQSPLGHVADNCSLAMARLLLEAGADPTFRPSAISRSALDKARNRKRGEGPRVYELLKQFSLR
jgi:ankyrin repeat protein